MIYQISNLITNEFDFVCPDQATIDTGKTAGYVGSFVIGTQTDADTILLSNQQNWLNACADRFSVSIEFFVKNGSTWNLCNLATEPFNTDRIYQVFDTISGSYVQAVGSDNANITQAQIKQNFIEHSNLATYTSFDTWPTLPKLGTQGTQTL